MKKKVVKIIAILGFVVILIATICNIYSWCVRGNQTIKINTSKKAFTNSDLYVSVMAQDNGVDLETKSIFKLLDSNGKTVKNVSVKYDGNNAILKIPDIEAGNYLLEAKVSSKKGKDTIKKDIYISNGNLENITINLDKGIYKPGDIVNFRALLTKKENDTPIAEDINICIYDGNDNKVYNENVKSSDYGIVSGNFHIANEVNSGLYKLVVKTESTEVTKQFKVNPYITPKYEVKINFDKESYLVGDKANITFDSNYFFGEPVKNANLTIYINDENYSLKTDDFGQAKLEYEIKDAKTYNVKVEAVDSSNYFVETKSIFSAGTDIFEIKLLPEHGNLVAGKKNDVYVFTNKIDGTPIKTYITVTSNNFTKQVATDENGIGKFSVDIEQISNNYESYKSYTNSSNNAANNTSNTSKQFSIVAQNMEGESVSKKISLNIEKKNILLSTDKVKYNEGEDIKINISSMTENARNIYFFKNDKLIKMITTDLNDTTINLDDTYGLVDIYVTEKQAENSNYNRSNSYKKTIFIKPSKQLKIDIATNKEEYKPGENISISFKTNDENNLNPDAALLISMLDNSVLNLANNDLSIDNIKLALQNIKFSDELDAASLYSCIINDSSEQTIMALLLKQANSDINLSETQMVNYEQKQKSASISIILILSLVVAITTFLCVKSKKVKNIVKHIVNFIIFDSLIVITTLSIMEEFFYNINYSWWIFGITTAICATIYILLLSKLNKKIFRTSLSILITFLAILILSFLVSILEWPLFNLIIIVVGILLILAILSKISEIKKLKINKYMKIVIKEIFYILKFIGATILSAIIGVILQLVFFKITDGGLELLIIPIFYCLLYYFNYLFNKLGKDIKYEKEKQNKKSIGKIVLIILAVIGIMAIGYIVIGWLSNINKPLDGPRTEPTVDYNTSSRKRN